MLLAARGGRGSERESERAGGVPAVVVIYRREICFEINKILRDVITISSWDLHDATLPGMHCSVSEKSASRRLDGPLSLFKLRQRSEEGVCKRVLLLLLRRKVSSPSPPPPRRRRPG